MVESWEIGRSVAAVRTGLLDVGTTALLVLGTLSLCNGETFTAAPVLEAAAFLGRPLGFAVPVEVLRPRTANTRPVLPTRIGKGF